MRKKKKKIKNMDYYYRCMKSGVLISEFGLCVDVNKGYITEKHFDRFYPTYNDVDFLRWEGLSIGFWASGVPHSHPVKRNLFTPLRQTIVLFIAAMNREL